MKKHDVVLLSDAWDDLRSICAYIAKNDTAAADRTADKIIQALRRLEMFPLSAPSVPDKGLSKEGYHVLRCDNYLCFYRISEKTVFVYHIAHGARDYPVLFRRTADTSAK